MLSITYKLMFDSKWSYILVCDTQKFDKKLINDIENLTSIISKSINLLNQRL